VGIFKKLLIIVLIVTGEEGDPDRAPRTIISRYPKVKASWFCENYYFIVSDILKVNLNAFANCDFDLERYLINGILAVEGCKCCV